MNYASIVPLIGGETIAMQNVFGKKPEYILSYEPFQANDNHLNEYYICIILMNSIYLSS